MESLPALLCVGLIVVVFVVPAWIWIEITERKNRAERAKAIEAGRHEPVTIQPYVDLSTCMGSGACVSACPEDVLRLIDGQAVAVNMAACIGHGVCVPACPVEAIELVFGSEKRGIDIPEVGPGFETNVKGLFVAGELGGMGLIASAAEQGTQAMEAAAVGLQKVPGRKDVLVIGAGPAGIAAALVAKQKGLDYLLVDQDAIGGAVRHYPRKKLVFTRPMVMPMYGKVNLKQLFKEELVKLFEDIQRKTGLEVSDQERVDAVKKLPDGGFSITTVKRTIEAQRVVLALGRRGTPRKLDVPGEDQEKVAYSLLEPEHYQEDCLLVVGGGDSAVEAAMQLGEQAGNRVWLSYRGDKINRPKEKNVKRLKEAVKKGEVELLLESQVKEVGVDRVVLDHKGETVVLPNDHVFVMVGGVLPTKFLQSAGIRIQKHFGKRVEAGDKEEPRPERKRAEEPPPPSAPAEVVTAAAPVASELAVETAILPPLDERQPPPPPKPDATAFGSKALRSEDTSILPAGLLSLPDPHDENTNPEPELQRIGELDTAIFPPPPEEDTVPRPEPVAVEAPAPAPPAVTPEPTPPPAPAPVDLSASPAPAPRAGEPPVSGLSRMISRAGGRSRVPDPPSAPNPEEPAAPAPRTSRASLEVEGRNHLARGDWEAAVGPLGAAVALARTEGDPGALAAALAALGRAHHHAGRFVEARDALVEALAVEGGATPRLPPEERASLHRLLGDLALWDGQLDDADRWFAQAESDTAVPDARARALRGQAHVLAIRGDFAASLAVLERATTLLDRGSRVEVTAAIHARALELELVTGAYGRALRRAEALVALTSQSSVDRLAEAVSLLAETLALLGMNDEAAEAAAQVDGLARHPGSRAIEARIRAARAACEVGQHATAIRLLAPVDKTRDSRVDDLPGQLLAVRARSVAGTDPRLAARLAGEALARIPPLLLISSARIRLDAAVALRDSGASGPARAAVKRGLKDVQGSSSRGMKLELLLAMYTTQPDVRVVEAVARSALKILEDLPEHCARPFRARAVVADALERWERTDATE